MKIILALVVNALALVITGYIVPGFNIDSFTTAILAAIILGVVNTFIRPILLFLTAPINLLTLGLFTFVVNALMLSLTAAIVPGIKIDGFVSSLLAAVVLSIVSTALSMLLGDAKKRFK